MVAHKALRHRRQTDPIAAPTGNGLDGATTVGTTAVAATLALDTTAGGGAVPTDSAPPLVASGDPVIHTAVSSGPTDAPEPTSVAASGTSSKVIPMSTVVGACLGALSGAVALILIGLWVYKRSEPKRRARRPHPMSSTRNAKGDLARKGAGMETWKKLDDDDKWETRYQTKEISQSDSVGPMEKLTMFKSPSIRTAYTHRSEEHPVFDMEPHPFAAYHPGLAKDMASNPAEPEKEPTPRQFLGRVDVGPAISWDSQGSFLTYQSRLSGAMSPIAGIAKSTPNVTSSEVHAWESAEVLDFSEPTEREREPADRESNNPFILDDSERRKSNGHNPFFGSSPSPKIKSLPKASIPEIVTPKLDKGKARDMTGSDGADPFDDQNTPIAPTFRAADATSSVAPSISSNDRALQSLIAALDIPAEEVQERLRVASMQPSIISNVSGYTTGGEDDVTEAFPIPPGQSFITP